MKNDDTVKIDIVGLDYEARYATACNCILVCSASVTHMYISDKRN